MVLIRRKGLAIVETEKGILLVSRKRKVFSLPGGGANYRESREDATKRELYEETGLTSKKLKYLFSYLGDRWKNSRGKNVRNLAKVFLVEAQGEAKPSNEINYISYLNENSNLKLSKRTIQILKKYYSIKNKNKKDLQNFISKSII